MIASVAFVSLHAQSREQTRDVILGNPQNNGTYGRNDRGVVLGRGNNGQYPNGSYGNNRQYQIDQVNREYDSKINSIRNNRYLNNSEKDRMIRQLEIDRQRQIEQINRQYYNNGYGRYDNDNDDRDDRRDNGKHKGWYKGKGNPHRNGNHDDDRDDD